jgi:natural product precursor
MKKLNKLQINQEKMMKDEELITLRGGVDCWCFTSPNGQGDVCITGVAGSVEACRDICQPLGCHASYSPSY